MSVGNQKTQNTCDPNTSLYCQCTMLGEMQKWQILFTQCFLRTNLTLTNNWTSHIYYIQLQHQMYYTCEINITNTVITTGQSLIKKIDKHHIDSHH